MKETFQSQLAEITISYSPKVKASERKSIRCSRDAEKAIREIIPSIEHREFFYLMCLNRANKILGYQQISAGGINGDLSHLAIF